MFILLNILNSEIYTKSHKVRIFNQQLLKKYIFSIFNLLRILERLPPPIKKGEKNGFF